MQLACCTPLEYCTRGDAVARDHHQLARLHVALIFRAQQIERAGFRGEHHRIRSIGIADAAHRERAKAVRIARGKYAVPRHHHDGECPVDLAQRIGDGIDQRIGMRSARSVAR